MPQPSHTRVARVLLVEDSHADALLIQRDLPGWTCHHVATLADGVQALEDGDYTLAIVDLGLPDSTAIDTVRTLRSRFPDISLLVVSDNIDPDVEFEALRLGASGFLVKGVYDPSELRHLAENV